MRGRHGRYEAVRKLAAGGMAQLHLGTIVGSPDSVVAIKEVLPEHAEDSAFQTMFLDEMRMAQALQHPNIVRTLDVGAHDKGFFLVMEFLHGRTLRDLMRTRSSRGGGLTLAAALTVVRGMAAGLQYAHDRTDDEGRPLNVVHRDVSPANVFLTWSGEVKLLDFGIAKAGTQRHETMAGTLKGKIPYMSPEQCLGENLDRRSDLYSLGVLMYEMTTSSRWVKRGADFAMMSQIVSGAFDPPSSVAPGYPPDLEAVVTKCLARRRTQRYQSAQQLIADLDAFIARHRVQVGPAAVTDALASRWGPPPPSPSAHSLPPIERTLSSSEGGAPHTPAKPTAAPPPVFPTSTPEIRRVGELQLITLRGRLTEAFQGAAIAGSVTHDAVLDLSGIERITSYGVREWLAMMAAMPRSTRQWLARCPEPIVNQLTLIRGFEAPARVLSFEAPFVCPGCGQSFRAMLDAFDHHDALRAGVPPRVRCASCGSDATYDDDPAAFEAVASTVDTDPPAKLRDWLGGAGRAPALHEREAPSTARVDKHVDTRATRLVLVGELAPTVRWRSAAEGVDGDVVVDLSGAAGVAPGGVAPLLAALRAAAPGTTGVSVLGAPAEVARALDGEPIAGVTLRSVRVNAPCRSCGVLVRPLVPVVDGRWSAAIDQFPCPACGAPFGGPGAKPVRSSLPPAPVPPNAAWALLFAGLVGVLVGGGGLALILGLWLWGGR
ncbi:MAG: serine/threonine-protein kinase [Myxococcota bacterium]